MSPRLDSPLPDAESSSSRWPIVPPMTAAKATKRIQPRIAVLRCWALHRPARAARLRDCIRAELHLRGGGEGRGSDSQRRAAPGWGQPGVGPGRRRVAAPEVAAPRAGVPAPSAHELAEAEQVALAVAEPAGALAARVLARVVA